jgi:SAM-dependent methyltransferase
VPEVHRLMVDCMADEIFEHPRLVAIYDAFDPDRNDLDVYVGIADQLGARRVLDVGCGTGTFAMLLANRGLEVTGVEPAGGSLDVAQAKPGANRVCWIHGDATTLLPMQVDLATMTADVAQAIVDLPGWERTLRGAYDALRPGGHLVFGTRDPAYRVWQECNREESYTKRCSTYELGVTLCLERRRFASEIGARAITACHYPCGRDCQLIGVCGPTR